MILESLVKDDRIISFDCVKSQLTKETKRISIPDHLVGHPEIQGAIKLGLVRLQQSLIHQEEYKQPEVQRTKFVCRHTSAISLDCIKRLVAPGTVVEIPNHFLSEPEVANAITWGFLVQGGTESFSEVQSLRDNSAVPQTKTINPDVMAYSPEAKPILDELKISDIIENPTEVRNKREENILKTDAKDDVFDFLPKTEETAASDDEIFGFLPQAPKPEPVVEAKVETKTEVIETAVVTEAPKPKAKAPKATAPSTDSSFDFFDIYNKTEGK